MQMIRNLPASEYHKIDALSASSAKLLLKSPAHYLAAMASPREPTSAMRLGTLCHTLLFEPDKLNEEFAIMPKLDKRTKIGKEVAQQFEEDNVGKTIVDEYQFERAKAIAEAARSHPIVAEHMVGGDAEVTMLWDEYDLNCKARVDYLRSNVIFDLKTCQDASPSGFARQIGVFQYHLQAAHYASGFETIMKTPLDRFVFIAVESEPPHATGVYIVNKEGLDAGKRFMEKASRAYKRAKETPNMRAIYSADMLEISLPPWALGEPFAEKD